jgi:FkbM family methyltransferase
MTVFDVGAHAGYFTLLFSRAVGPSGTVFAFEPDPSNLARLHRNLALNVSTNVRVIPSAVTDRKGKAQFVANASMGHVSDEGKLSVSTCRLDDFPPPDLVKMDIEGSENLALSGAENILALHHAIFFIELHGTAVSAACIDMLVRHGYRIERIGADHILANR